jgi:hypothetical protein
MLSDYDNHIKRYDFRAKSLPLELQVVCGRSVLKIDFRVGVFAPCMTAVGQKLPLVVCTTVRMTACGLGNCVTLRGCSRGKLGQAFN